MSGGDICRHGDLLGECIDCTVAPPKPVIVKAASPPFTAAYSGTCKSCGFEILDEWTVLATDGTYRHAACLPPMEKP